jgi:hypothetical protein
MASKYAGPDISWRLKVTRSRDNAFVPMFISAAIPMILLRSISVVIG